MEKLTNKEDVRVYRETVKQISEFTERENYDKKYQ